MSAKSKPRQQQPANLNPPAGQEWQILDKTSQEQMAGWQDTAAGYRQRIDKIRRRDIELRLTDRAGKPHARRAVRVVQTNSDFLWGFGGWGLLNALRTGEVARLSVERRHRALAGLFNAVNLMHYWAERHCADAPVSEEFQGFADYDNLQQGVNWALSNALVPKGHPIFWPVPKAIPAWLANYDNATRYKFLEIRVRTIARRFRGRMKLYDAVNEAIWEPSFADTAKRHWPHLAKIERIADDIEKVLRWAREEDPDACYLVNDYGIVVGEHEKIPIKCHDGSLISRHEQAQRYATLIHELQKRGAAPDAVGIQNFHSAERLDQFVATFDLLGTQTGLPVHITEFGPGKFVGQMAGAGAPREEIMERIWQYDEAVLTVAFGHPSVDALFFWYAQEYLFDEKGYPSALYKRLHDLIHRQWRTDETLRTDAAGRVRLRGFCGDYRVRLLPQTKSGHQRGVSFQVPQASRGKLKLDLAIGE
jgi:endo-1,4-beta-xylanase